MKCLSGFLIKINFSIVLEMRCYDKLVGVKKQTKQLQEAGNWKLPASAKRDRSSLLKSNVDWNGEI